MAALRPFSKYLLGSQAAAAASALAPASSSAQIAPWIKTVGSYLGLTASSLHTSSGTAADAPTASAGEGKEIAKDYSKYNLLDKDVWDEVWAYEDRFGTEENPIMVPSVEAERIVGVTDPEDDSLVIWGILREGEEPRQFVEGGEFFMLQRVEDIPRVGDLIDKGVLPPVPPAGGH
jgi:cytochrome c oxidase subunit 5b